MRRALASIGDALIRTGSSRAPDFIIGGAENPYLLRWYLVPWRKWHHEARENPTLWRRVKGFAGLALPSVYLHCFLRDDDDRALHDHPWFWCSILLRGGYIEHTKTRSRARWAGSVKAASPWRAHRIELFPNLPSGRCPAWTLFITGPRVRSWGFHCPNGWVHWRKFTAPGDTGSIGRGCDG